MPGEFTAEQGGDQVAAEEEEDRDAEAARDDVSPACMADEHDHDRDEADAVERLDLAACWVPWDASRQIAVDQRRFGVAARQTSGKSQDVVNSSRIKQTVTGVKVSILKIGPESAG